MVNEESKHVKIEIISSSKISVLDILFVCQNVQI